ncbi:MAG: MBL fold metallo-hydrolase [Candidatus Kariarchaeaceae archaeon]
MNVKKVGTRGYYFIYSDVHMDGLNEPVNVYVINGPKHLFVCDTHYGPEIMEEIFAYLKEQGLPKKPVIVFNSHYDMDHVWGNCYFKSIDRSMIISHVRCREILLKEWKQMVDQFGSRKRGEVELTLPNLVFQQRIVFEDDGVEFFYSPGHTEDSSSCIDHMDKVLFVGDNILQEPVPYLDRSDIDTFKTTLEEYLDLDVDTIIGTHIDILTDKTRIEELIEYMRNFKTLTVNQENFTQLYKFIHRDNAIVFARSLGDEGNKEEALKYFKEAKQTLANLGPLEEEMQNRIDEAQKRTEDEISQLMSTFQ